MNAFLEQCYLITVMLLGDANFIGVSVSQFGNIDSYDFLKLITIF